MPTSSAPTAGRTAISVSAIADCAFSIAEEYATEFLRSAEAGGPEALIRIPLAVPNAALQHRVGVRFGLHFDILEKGRAHDEVRFRWTSGSRRLPDFHGTLRFQIEGLRTRILIDGSYRAPLGALGRAFDRIAGKHIARASLADLADRLARYLGAREHAWRNEQLKKISVPV